MWRTSAPSRSQASSEIPRSSCLYLSTSESCSSARRLAFPREDLGPCSSRGEPRRLLFPNETVRSMLSSGLRRDALDRERPHRLPVRRLCSRPWRDRLHALDHVRTRRLLRTPRRPRSPNHKTARKLAQSWSRWRIGLVGTGMGRDRRSDTVPGERLLLSAFGDELGELGVGRGSGSLRGLTDASAIALDGGRFGRSRDRVDGDIALQTSRSPRREAAHPNSRGSLPIVSTVAPAARRDIRDDRDAGRIAESVQLAWRGSGRWSEYRARDRLVLLFAVCSEAAYVQSSRGDIQDHPQLQTPLIAEYNVQRGKILTADGLSRESGRR